MPMETQPIPELAKSAITFVAKHRAEFEAQQQAVVNALGVQTLEVMGLSQDEGWMIDFDAGVAKRAVPDAPIPDAPIADAPDVTEAGA